MTAGALLATLRARGVTLLAQGERLRYRPTARVREDERAALARHREELLELLRGEEVRLAAEVLGARVVSAEEMTALEERDALRWRRRYRTRLLPPGFHAPTEARGRVERGAELAAWQARLEAAQAARKASRRGNSP